MCNFFSLALANVLLLAACHSVDMAAEDASTCSRADCITEKLDGHAMLQAKSKLSTAEVAVHVQKLAPNPACVLPAQAKWCEVRLLNLAPYWMAVYDTNLKKDVVSHFVCTQGYWDENNTALFGVPGHAVDIGTNIGYFTLMLANAGWNVTSFEPMAPNLALLNASLCQNPQFVARVKVLPYGLGPEAKQCSMVAPSNNLGDGHVQCAGDLASGFSDDPTRFDYIGNFDVQLIGQFSIRRLDQLLLENNVSKIDFVKIDVEGYESQVLAGAPNFLTQYQPRLNKLEIWRKSFGFNGTHFVNLYRAAGYSFFEDPTCTIPKEADLVKVGVWEGFACKPR